MPRSLHLAALAAAVLISGTAVAAPSENLAAYADRILTEAYPATEPGAAVLVRDHGKVVLRKGYGLASVELGVPIVPEHVFEIGSVTKQFTAASILLLAERGKLSLSDPITRFLPDFPTHGETITIEQLLTHTSGVPSYTEMPEWVPRWREDMSVDTLIGIFRGKPLDFKPGERWSYSNSGFVLLGAVIEKASGKSYEDFVEQEIFAKLGMTHSRYGHQEEVVPGRADGYGKNGAELQRAPYLSLTQPYAAGSLLSNVDDLARWLDALRPPAASAGAASAPAASADAASSALLSADSRQRMFTPEILHGGALDGVSTRYGFGYGVGTVAKHRALEHSGGIFGYVCDVLTLPDDGLQVIVLSNNAAGKVDPTALVHRIASKAVGAPIEERRTIAVAEAKLAEYPAVYRVVESDKDRRVISLKGSELSLQRTGGERHGLHAVARDTFVDDGDTEVRFERDVKGKVAAVVVDSGFGPLSRSPRTDEAPPAAHQTVEVAPEVLAPLVGTYNLAPGFDIAITREEAHLFAQATGQPRLALLALSPTRFALADVDAEIEFVNAPDGTVNLILHQGGQDMPGKRKL